MHSGDKRFRCPSNGQHACLCSLLELWWSSRRAQADRCMLHILLHCEQPWDTPSPSSVTWPSAVEWRSHSHDTLHRLIKTSHHRRQSTVNNQGQRLEQLEATVRLVNRSLISLYKNTHTYLPHYRSCSIGFNGCAQGHGVLDLL